MFNTSALIFFSNLGTFVCLSIAIVEFAHGLPTVQKKETENAVAEEAHQISDATATESKGIFQSVTDTVKEYTVNKVLNLYKTMPVECKSKINKSGKLIATKKGKAYCKEKCQTIYDKIDAAKETIAKIRSYLPFGQSLKLKSRRNENLPKFRCARNLTRTKLICDCPQAPELSFGKSLKHYLEKTFLEPSKAARGHHHHYPPPYYGGYGYGPYYGSYGNYGPHWGFNPMGDLFSMIFYPLKILFFLVTLPFWLFLIIFLGVEIGDMLFD